jgi:hypothetical protein
MIARDLCIPPQGSPNKSLTAMIDAIILPRNTSATFSTEVGAWH